MTVRLKIRPMERWDGPEVVRSSSARFRVKWTAIRDHLLNECDMLGAALVTVQLVIDPKGLRQDGALRANAKVLHPGVKVSFESNHGPLTYATDAYERQWPGDLPGWQANLRAIGLGLEALRAVDRYGITRLGEQYRGFMAIGSNPAAHEPMTFERAFRMLSPFGPLTDADEVKRAFKAAAGIHHPDAGGNDEAFQMIVSARDALLARWS